MHADLAADCCSQTATSSILPVSVACIESRTSYRSIRFYHWLIEVIGCSPWMVPRPPSCQHSSRCTFPSGFHALPYDAPPLVGENVDGPDSDIHSVPAAVTILPDVAPLGDQFGDDNLRRRMHSRRFLPKTKLFLLTARTQVAPLHSVAEFTVIL